MARWSSEAEEVPDCSRLNWWVISNHQPPMTLRAGPQGTGESSREWGGSEALPPPPGPCAWAGYPLSPPRGRAVGERNAARFLQHLSLPVGASGERNAGLFFAASFIRRGQEGRALPAARRQLPPHQAGQGLLPRKVHGLAGPRPRPHHRHPSGAATPAGPTSATTSCPSPWSTAPCPGSPAASATSRPTPA